MERIRQGWRLMVVDPSGVVRDSVDLSDTDLSKPTARAIVCEEIADIIERAEA